MQRSAKPGIFKRVRGFARGRMPWLQLVACGVLAIGWFYGHSAFETSATRHAISQTTSPPAAPAPAPAAEPIQIPAIQIPERPPQQAASLGLSTIEVIVTRNDTLDRIFRRLQLNLADLASVRNLPGVKSHLDRLRPGESLTLQHRDGQLMGFVRQLSPSETLKVVKDDAGFNVDVLENPLEMRVRTVSGVIDSSLFEAVTNSGAHEPTALALAEVFGYDIDFVLDIQRGDAFTVTYEEVMQDGRYVKDGAILAARFVNQGKEYLAVRYVDPNGREGYYSPDGKSLRKAFLRAPLEFSRISSGFNMARRHPILNRIRAHKGVDYAAPTGTPVRAAGDGRVIFAGVKGGYGNVVEIDHSRGVVTRYGHLSRFASGTRVGKRVNQGSVIAYVGMSGLATGPHLHYEYQLNGAYKNPQTVKLPEAVPIDAKLRDDFLAKTQPLVASLDLPVGPALVAR
jgi:murein DD-endopeptidase MepM/ murein hydrolase activator NlpD